VAKKIAAKTNVSASKNTLLESNKNSTSIDTVSGTTFFQNGKKQMVTIAEVHAP